MYPASFYNKQKILNRQKEEPTKNRALLYDWLAHSQKKILLINGPPDHSKWTSNVPGRIRRSLRMFIF